MITNLENVFMFITMTYYKYKKKCLPSIGYQMIVKVHLYMSFKWKERPRKREQFKSIFFYYFYTGFH